MTKLFGNRDRKANELASRGVVVQYESMKEFDEMLDDARHISGRDRESSDEGNAGWAGTPNWGTAEDLRKYGDRPSLEMLAKTKAVTDKAFNKFVGNRAKTFNDVHGFQPIVPNAIIGLPQAMINQKRYPKKVKAVDVFVNASTRCGVSKEDMALRGAYTLSVIDALERDGYRVNLYVGKLSWDSGRVVGGFINLKKAEHPLNLTKIAYYVVNPSFLRRTLFRFCENEPLIPDITGGYGSNTEFKKQKQFIKDAIDNPNLVVVDSSVNISRDNSEEENVNHICDAFKGVLDLKELD